MKDLADYPGDQDYVDRLIDQVLADPTRVDDVKTLLKHKMGMHDALSVVDQPHPVSPVEEDAEDLWDNVPV